MLMNNQGLWEFFPTKLKRAVLTLTYDKDDIMEPVNYRPPSITTSFSET